MSKFISVDPVFNALACMGNASYLNSEANGWLEDVDEVPSDLKKEIRQVNATIQALQEKLRAYRKAGINGIVAEATSITEDQPGPVQRCPRCGNTGIHYCRTKEDETNR